MLCGCTGNETQRHYVDIEKQQQKIEDNRLDIQTENFKYDDKPYNIMKLTSTIDSNYFYDFSFPNIKINLDNGRIQSVCQIPGCAHDAVTSVGCIGYQDFISPIATVDGIYYVDNDSVVLQKENSQSTIIKNKYYTDYEKENYPDNKNIISALVINNDIMYVICPTYFFTYDLINEKISEMHKTSNSLCMAFCCTDEYAYFTNENMEMYLYNLKDKSVKKLDDKVGQVCEKDDHIYYIKYDNDIPVLFSAEADGSNSKALINDCYVNYYITDNYIYYQSYYKKENLYRCDLKGENQTVIDLQYIFSNGRKYAVSNYVNIVSANSIKNHLFIVDSNEQIIFSINENPIDYKVIDFTEE